MRHLADAIAPSLMIAYAIGRIGCQVAGDGDWGIYNSAYKVDANNEIVLAAPNDFRDTVLAHSSLFGKSSSIDSIPHKTFVKPSALAFLPDWVFAYHYPRNVNKMGVPIADCNDIYCNRLAVPVFPTPFYETLMCIMLFAVLWALRKRLKPAGAVFCLYLILNGLERFLIEKIRVNNQMELFGWRPTQAEVISLGLMVTGTIFWIILWQKNRATHKTV